MTAEDSLWGYCEDCAFEVALLPDGSIQAHERRIGGFSFAHCDGGGKMPSEAPAEALPPVKGTLRMEVRMDSEWAFTGPIGRPQS